MSTHTAGPWRDDQRTGLILAADGDIVADFVRPEDRPLIAAAPELLAACQRMLDCHQAAMDAAQSHAAAFTERRCECGACDEARGAIAKAEGRT